MRMENQIHDLLIGKLVINGIDNTNDGINKLNEIAIKVYEKINEQGKKEFLKDCGAYLMAKAMEQQVLVKIRKKANAWFILDEMKEGAAFNLPAHIEEKMYDYMDACDKAITMYVEGKKTLPIQTFFTRIQNIGAYFANRDELYKVMVDDLSNEEVMIRDEMYNFSINTCGKYLEDQGYKIEKVFPGYGSPINFILTKDNVTYHVSLIANLAPNQTELEGWRLKAALESIKNSSKKLAKINVQLRSKDPQHQGVAITKGEYEVKISPLQIFTPKTNNKVS